MSMFAMTLMREMIAAWNRFKWGGTGVWWQRAVHPVADAESFSIGSMWMSVARSCTPPQ